MPSFIQILIGVNVIAFALQQVLGDAPINLFALWPPFRGDWMHSSLMDCEYTVNAAINSSHAPGEAWASLVAARARPSAAVAT